MEGIVSIGLLKRKPYVALSQKSHEMPHGAASVVVCMEGQDIITIWISGFVDPLGIRIG